VIETNPPAESDHKAVAAAAEVLEQHLSTRRDNIMVALNEETGVIVVAARGDAGKLVAGLIRAMMEELAERAEGSG
jgi:hypothetical protein